MFLFYILFSVHCFIVVIRHAFIRVKACNPLILLNKWIDTLTALSLSLGFTLWIYSVDAETWLSCPCYSPGCIHAKVIFYFIFYFEPCMFWLWLFTCFEFYLPSSCPFTRFLYSCFSLLLLLVFHFISLLCLFLQSSRLLFVMSPLTPTSFSCHFPYLS